MHVHLATAARVKYPDACIAISLVPRMLASGYLTEEAENDLKKLDHSVQLQVLKGIRKVSQNPLPVQEGGYGKPLGNRTGNNLTNLLKIKFRNLGIRVVYKTIQIDGIMKIIVISARTDEQFRNLGIRVVYKTIQIDGIMKIIVISARTDEQVYKEAGKRREKYDL